MPLRLHALLALIVVAVLAVFPPGRVPESAPPPRLPAPDGARIAGDVAALASFPTRFAGSERAREVVDLLEARLREAGAEPVRETFALSIAGRKTEQTNLYAFLPGAEPRAPRLLLLAHHDSINEGWEGETASLADPESPAPGADDNASGVAVLLETLRLLAGAGGERGVGFLLCAAEELGQAGSRAWIDADPERARGFAWVINVDQVGRSRSGPRGLQLFTREQGIPFARRVRELGAAACPLVPSWRLHLADALGKSDHGPFLDLGLPALSLSEGAGYYPWEAQGEGDLPERLDPLLLDAAVRLLSATALAADLHPPAASRWGRGRR